MFSNQIARMWKYKWYGFWGAELEGEGRVFNFDEYVDCTCPSEILEKIKYYLGKLPEILAAQQPPQKCSLCDERLYYSAFKSDAVWLWNDSLLHYVEKHHFCVPNQMVNHILSSNGIPPSEINISLDCLPWP